MSGIDINKSWLSDHPLISLFDLNNDNLKLGVFNVLSKFASDIGTNAGKAQNLNQSYKNIIIKEGFGLQIIGGSLMENDEKTYKIVDFKKTQIPDVNELERIAKAVLKFITINQVNLKIIDSVKYDSLEKIKSHLQTALSKSGTNTREAIHQAIIMDILQTQSMGGFEYTVHNCEITKEDYIIKKGLFLKKQIADFFKDTDGILVCPEFDWIELLELDDSFKGITEAKNIVIDAINVVRLKATINIDGIQIDAILCGGFWKSNKKNSDANFCKVVFYKGLEFNECKKIEVPSGKQCLDKITFTNNKKKTQLCLPYMVILLFLL